jgi:sugar phosphate isomerase/epimerase
VVGARSINVVLLDVRWGQGEGAVTSLQGLLDKGEQAFAVSLGPIDEAAARFAEICDAAAEHGLLVQLEFFPWTDLRDLTTAWEVVRLADRPNGGLHLDTWHYFRSGGGSEQLASVPADRIFCVQVSDGPAERLPGIGLVEETIGHRVLPGDGTMDLTGLFHDLAQVGAASPVCCEVYLLDPLPDGSPGIFNPEQVPPAQATRRLADAMRRLMATANSS